MPAKSKDKVVDINRAQKRRETKAALNGHVTVTNGDIFGAKEALEELMRHRFPIRTSFALAKMASAVNGHLPNIQMVRKQIIENYGTLHPEKRGNYQLPEEGTPERDAFNKEIEELMALEVEVDSAKVTLPSELPDDLGIAPGVLFTLSPFIDMEEAPA